MKKAALLAALMVGIVVPSVCNDIQVTNASLTGQDVSAGTNNPANFTLVQFDVSWSNSWRISTGPNNWDAAWVFVKYRIEGGPGCTAGAWQHATLSNIDANHVVITNNGVPVTIRAASDGSGIFIYRTGDGNGAVDWDQVRLRWNYGANGVFDACNVTVRVFAVEMVHIPQASYFIGDGSTTVNGQLRTQPANAPFQVTGEGALTLGGSGAGSLNNNNAGGQSAPVDDFNNTTSQSLSAVFPKGFAAIYSMKYEITQEQYAEFLNTLTATQQLSRHGATVVNRYIDNGTTPVTRNGVKCTVLPGASPGTYVCDLNNNNIGNEPADGQNIAIARISTQDLLSYLDWSALRPMTEMEYEKMGRGPLPAVPNEFAWGSSSIHGATYAPLTGAGTGAELPNAPSTTVGNTAINTTAFSLGGPLRVGLFATATSSRSTAGASYYGVMELTGNLWELVVGLGHVAGRSFTGVHGNGLLSSTGFADADFWPGSNGNSSVSTANVAPNTGSTQAAGMMFRGGSWQDGAFTRLSDRQFPGWAGLNTREPRIGGRGVRVAP